MVLRNTSCISAWCRGRLRNLTVRTYSLREAGQWSCHQENLESHRNSVKQHVLITDYVHLPSSEQYIRLYELCIKRWIYITQNQPPTKQPIYQHKIKRGKKYLDHTRRNLQEFLDRLFPQAIHPLSINCFPQSILVHFIKFTHNNTYLMQGNLSKKKTI